MKTGSERRSDERQQPAAAATAQAPAPPGVAQLLALQQGAGNAAVARFLDAEHASAADLRAGGGPSLPPPHAEPLHTPGSDLRGGPDPQDERSRQAATIDRLAIDHYERAIPLLRQVHAALIGPLTAAAGQEGAAEHGPPLLPNVRPMALVPLEIAVAMLNTGRQLRRNAATVRGDDEITTLRGSRLDVIVDQCLIEAVPWRAHISALSGPVAVGIFQAIAERILEQTVAMEVEIVMTRVTTRR